jgi:hypothetical protein
MKNTLLLFAAGALLLAASFPTSCLAQVAAPPQFYRVTLTHVKPDMLNEWLDLQKNEVVPALKKAGQKTRTVLVTSLFGNAYEYLVITPFEKYAEFDEGNPMIKALGQPGAARLNEKIRKCVVSSTSYSNTRLTEISNILEGPLPAKLVTVRYRIAPGKMTEFENLVKSDVLPVYKKAKVALLVSRRGPGANTTDVTMSTGLSKYADLDGGAFLTKQLGQEAANRINAKFAGIRTLIEVVVRSRVDELSF